MYLECGQKRLFPRDGAVTQLYRLDHFRIYLHGNTHVLLFVSFIHVNARQSANSVCAKIVHIRHKVVVRNTKLSDANIFVTFNVYRCGYRNNCWLLIAMRLISGCRVILYGTCNTCTVLSFTTLHNSYGLHFLHTCLSSSSQLLSPVIGMSSKQIN